MWFDKFFRYKKYVVEKSLSSVPLIWIIAFSYITKAGGLLNNNFPIMKGICYNKCKITLMVNWIDVWASIC